MPAATWERVERMLEVRARLVVALDFIEDGNPRMAELALFGLLDDPDGVEAILAPAKRAAWTIAASTSGRWI